MMKALCLALVVGLAPPSGLAKEKPPATYSIPLPPRPDFSALEWMVGEWSGKTTGKGPQGDVHFSASYDLDRRFMILREDVSLPATSSIPASKETSIGILGGAGSDFILQWFSTTGFITRYRLSVSGSEISVNPEGGDNPPPGWLFRRLIEHPDPSQFIETVQAAPAGKPFFDLFAARLTRVATAKPSSAAPSH